MPAQFLRGVLGALRGRVRPGLPVLHCAKGIEIGTLATMSQIGAELLPGSPYAVLSGPSFAAEVASGLPTAVTIASADTAVAKLFMAALGGNRFRPYLSPDPVGAEIGGAVKNVLAIACGIVVGRGLGDNARAALITRGLAEMVRLGVAQGAQAETFRGLSGLGDLVLTCGAGQSRNHALGLALGHGHSLKAALAGRRSVVEGVATAGCRRRIGGAPRDRDADQRSGRCGAASRRCDRRDDRSAAAAALSLGIALCRDPSAAHGPRPRKMVFRTAGKPIS